MSFRRKIAAFVAATVALVGVVGAFAADTGNDTPYTYSLITVDAINENGARIEGAELQLLKADGSEFASWTSGDKAQVIENVPSGNYTIREVKAPKNFKKAADVPVVLENNGKSKIVYKVSHEATITYDVAILKVCDVKKMPGTYIRPAYGINLDYSPYFVKGAKMQLLKNGEVVDEWISGDDYHGIEGLEPGDYVIHEVEAPAGYITNKEDKAFTLKDNGKSQNVFLFNNERTELGIYKKDVENDKLLAGAEFDIINAEGETVAHLISGVSADGANGGAGDGAHSDDDTLRPDGCVLAFELPYGNYTIHETKAPEGFEKAADTTVELSEKNPKVAVTVYDERLGLHKSVDFKKVDITTKDEIEGAKLAVYKYAENNIDKTLVEEWTSTKEAKTLKLKTGKYLFVENVAPAGYVKAESIEFEVKDGELERPTDYAMEDDYTRVNIEKVDADKKFVKGAKLELKSKDGKTVYTWESGDDVHRIDRIPVGIYTLTELEAPKGYEKAEPKQIEVLETSKVQTFELVNKKTTVYEVTISKQDMANSKELEGAKLVIKNKDGKVVEEWTSGKEARVIKTLEPGDYTLEEISAPSGYVKAEKIGFTVGKSGKVETSVTMKDDVTRVEIHKQNKETEKELKGAKLELMGPDGKLVEEWTSDGSAKVFKGLKHGKYTLKEVEAPEGFKKADDITFEVTDEPKTIKVYMYDEKDGKTVKEEKEKVKEKEKAEKEKDNKKEKVQTSDDNNVMPYVLLALALILAGGVAIKVKSKNDNDSNNTENK